MRVLKQEGSSKQAASYSKVSIIRPVCSRLLEFENISTGYLIETFSKIPDQDV